MPDSHQIVVEDPRLRLAGERTMLAWIRTGLAMMGFGFVVARFGLFVHEMAVVEGRPTGSLGGSVWLGTALVILGVAVLLFAAMGHARFLRRISQGQAYCPPRWSLGVIVAVLLAIIGAGMTVYLLMMSAL
jgi:putative membrane protein